MRRIVPAVMVLALTAWSSSSPGQARKAGLVGRWLGQDGRDLVGATNTPGASGIQDIHLVVAGLPPGRTITEAHVKTSGGAQWQYVREGQGGAWRAEVVQNGGTADLFIEPYQIETGRPFDIEITLDDRRKLSLTVAGGRADPKRRAAGAGVGVRWIGQDQSDRTGLGAGVGPDGFQDVRLALTALAGQVEIKEVRIEGPAGTVWCSGVNPDRKNNAELVRNGADPSRGDLFFQPDRDLAGATLKLSLTYANGRTDTATVTGSRCDPRLRAPIPAGVRLVPSTITARWLGQDGTPGTKPGDVHVSLEGLSRSHVVAAVALSGPVRTTWFARGDERAAISGEPYARPLIFRRRPDPTKADLFFGPERDESGGTMTLRLIFGDGSMTVVSFPGGPADVARRAGPGPAPTTVTARPGQDLQTLVNASGTVKLPTGTYRLDRPLILNRPVTISGEPGSTLLFDQRPASPPWSAAILVHAGHVTLEGFAVRFAGPVRWREGIRHGPAVIGLPDERMPAPPLPITDLTFRKLDLQAPPPARPDAWEWCTNLMRLYGAESGRVEDCTLKGGLIDFFGGPWRFTGNEHRGTIAGTQTGAVFAGHDVHDVVIAGNRTRLEAPAGKTWRFVVLTGSGYQDVIENNQIEGIGPRETDTLKGANAPETILTEAYGLHYEGTPAAISADGRTLYLPEPQGGPAGTGALVAVLSGSKAGTWHRVAQAINDRVYLVDPPLSRDAQVISVATGFVAETIRGNTIDARGTEMVEGLVLVGNLFGAKVAGNRFLGGGKAFRIASLPSERPVHWGWSHSPVLGLAIESNTIEDAAQGGFVTVEHGPHAKTSQGRVYLSAGFHRNTAVWSQRDPRSRTADRDRVGFTIGENGAADPSELIITESGNTTTAAGATMRIHAATVNGKTIRNQTVTLPASTASAPAGRSSR